MATIGLLLSPRGVGLFVAMIVLGRFGSAIDPRLQIASGFVLLAASSWWMSRWNLEVGAAAVVWTGLMQGLGAGSIIGPLGVLTFASLPAAASHRGGVDVEPDPQPRQQHRDRRGARDPDPHRRDQPRRPGRAISPYNEIMRSQPLPGGGELDELSSLLALDAEIARQALMIGYVDVFYLCAIASVLAIPLIPLLVRPGRAK